MSAQLILNLHYFTDGITITSVFSTIMYLLMISISVCLKLIVFLKVRAVPRLFLMKDKLVTVQIPCSISCWVVAIDDESFQLLTLLLAGQQ